MMTNHQDLPLSTAKNTTRHIMSYKPLNPVLEAIHHRRSIGKLSLPIPTDEQMAHIWQAAMDAPDHKQLKPWQFVVLTGDALVEFGEVLLTAQQAQAERAGEMLDDAAIKKTKNMPLRAPMIIMVATNIQQHEKVPEFEQLLSAGAATQNILLALQSMGYQSVWRTGLLCNEPAVKSYFNVADKDTVCGFVYVGSSDIQMPPKAQVELDDLVEYRNTRLP